MKFASLPCGGGSKQGIWLKCLGIWHLREWEMVMSRSSDELLF